MSDAAPEPPESPEPYIGPRPFEANDRDRHLFFGRDQEKHEVSSLILANKFLLLYAASGAGKTSLVNAGVLPLVQDELEVLPMARFQARGQDEISDVANVYTHAVLSRWAEPDELRHLGQTTLTDYLESRPPEDQLADLPVPRLLVFDQFEELFTTYPERWPERQQFLAQLMDASNSVSGLRVLIVMREDYMSRLLGFYDSLHGGLQDRYFLEPLRRSAAELAIESPLAGTGRSFSSDAVRNLVQRLMASRIDIGGAGIVEVQGEFVEPVLLQVVCQTLWNALPSSVSTISLEHVLELADVDTSLARFYSETVQKAAAQSNATEAQIREWFQENLFTHPGGTRAAVYQGATTTEGMPNEVVRRLEGKLLRGEFRAGARWLEITHDSLLRPIERSNGEFFGAAFAGADTALTQRTDMLAAAVKEQWTRAAFEEGLQPQPIPVRWQWKSQVLAGSPAAGTGPRHFPSLPGVPGAGEGRRQDGGLPDLLALYGGLGSGRIVVVGSPGSGKTATAMLLVLAALTHREQVSSGDRPLVPVPVLFTLSGWDPYTERIGDWLTVQLQETYPGFQVKEAAELVRTDRIAVILDGFDEIPAELRSTALRALSQQATFRVVLFARTKEMATAAKQTFLDGAAEIELQGIDPSAVADYLVRVQLDPAQAGWRELNDRICRDPNGPLARALSHPGTLALVRDTFRGDNVRELLAVSDAAGEGLTGATIEDLLLGRVLPAAYAPRPGDATPRYHLQAAQRALSYLASRMNQDGTADLAWWRVPAWTARAPQVAVFGLGLGAVFGALAGIGAGRAFALAFGIGAGLVFGIVVALVDAHRRGSRSPARAVSRRRRVSIGFRLVGGLVFGLVFGLGGRLLFGPLHSVPVRLVGGLVFGLVFGLAAGLAQPRESTVSILGPRAFWQRSRARGLLTGLAFGLVGVLVGGLAFGLVGGLVAGLGTGVAVVLTLFPDTWLASVAFGQLALNGRTPVRLMLFLEDARERGVLRNVGPVYQFRHPRMQDWLAPERTDHK
jgi:hypothetical protein